MVYKIIVFTIPAVGHSNPIIKIVNELIKTNDVKVIVYSIKNFKSQIEAIGAEYRQLDDTSYEETADKLKFNDDSLVFFYTIVDEVYRAIESYVPKVIKIIEDENPDIILHDALAFTISLAINYLKKKHQKFPSTSFQIPPSNTYWTTFISEKGIYPNELEEKNALKFTKFQSLRLLGSSVWYEVKYRRLFSRLNLDYPGIKALFQRNPTSNWNLVLIFPELHPRSHLFDSNNTKFIGACITDDVHITGAQKHENIHINQVLQDFPIINPSYIFTEVTNVVEKNSNTVMKLIYVSFGTVFNENLKMYSILIEAASKAIEEMIGFKLVFIFSLGTTLFNHYQNEIKNKVVTIPENIILAASVPQLEILKRASLFITHSGMNSTSESVHYGVPMICLPINGDQPGNAYRIATELGLGIEFDFQTVKSNDIKTAIHKILNDVSFYKRSSFYAKFSSEYVGHKNAVEIIMRCIKDK